MKDKKIKKKIVLLLKPMTKTSQLNGKSKEDFFRRVLSPKQPFKMAVYFRETLKGNLHDSFGYWGEDAKYASFYDEA